MKVQALNRVCSVAHLHDFGAYATPEDFAKDLRAQLKAEAGSRHLMLVVGPKQEIIRKGINILRREGLAKRCAVMDTGHGGETTIWLAYNRFRGNPIPA